VARIRAAKAPMMPRTTIFPKTLFLFMLSFSFWFG
jgi:hypothetical protein